MKTKKQQQAAFHELMKSAMVGALHNLSKDEFQNLSWFYQEE